MNKTNIAGKSRLLLCALLLIGQSTLFSGPNHSKQKELTRGPGAIGVSMLLVAAVTLYYFKQQENILPKLQYSTTKGEDEAIQKKVSPFLRDHIDNLNQFLTYKGTKSTINQYPAYLADTYDQMLLYVENNMDMDNVSLEILFYLTKKINDLLAHFDDNLSLNPSSRKTIISHLLIPFMGKIEDNREELRGDPTVATLASISSFANEEDISHASVEIGNLGSDLKRALFACHIKISAAIKRHIIKGS